MSPKCTVVMSKIKIITQPLIYTNQRYKSLSYSVPLRDAKIHLTEEKYPHATLSRGHHVRVDISDHAGS